MMNEYCWFIERKDNRWFCGFDYEDGVWTTDPNEAIRFSRKEDAEKFSKNFGHPTFNNTYATQHSFIDRSPQSAQEPVAPSDDISARITAYLTGGGLFNPEMANHDRVRDLLIDCRDRIDMLNDAHPVTTTAEHGAIREPEQSEDSFKEALLDALVVCHIYRADHDNSPRDAIHDLVNWNVQVALDPLVSSDAQALIERGRTTAEQGERVSVPREPTEKMVEAALKDCGRRIAPSAISSVYRAMLAASEQGESK